MRPPTTSNTGYSNVMFVCKLGQIFDLFRPTVAITTARQLTVQAFKTYLRSSHVAMLRVNHLCKQTVFEVGPEIRHR